MLANQLVNQHQSMGEFPAYDGDRRRHFCIPASWPLFCLLLLAWGGGARTAAAPVQLAGNTAFVADQLGRLKMVDISGGTNAATLLTLPELNGISGIALHGHYATVSVTNEGLYVFDLSVTPPALVSDGRFLSIGSAEDVKVAGSTAFLADGDYGIVVLDLFDPSRPAELPSVFPDGIVTSLDIVSNRLFAACGTGGLLMLDISNVSEIVSFPQFATANPARRIRVAGNNAFVLCDGGRVEIINIQNPASPSRMATYIGSGAFVDVDVKGNFAVLANTNGNLTVLNVADPAHPVVQTNRLVAAAALGVRLSGANAYVRTGAGGLAVVTLAALNPSGPELKEGVLPQVVAAGEPVVLSVRAIGSPPLRYSWSHNGVPLVDDSRIRGATNSWLVISNALLTDGGNYSVTISNAFGQLASSNALTVVNPGAPVWRGWFDLGGTVSSLDVNDSKVFVAAGTNGLEIYDASDPRYPKRAGGNCADGFATGVQVNEGFVYVAAATNGVQVFSRANLFRPELFAVTNTVGAAQAVFLEGGLAYVADGAGGLEIFHLNGAQAAPTLVGNYDTPGFAWNVFVAGGIAYVADGAAGIQMLSVTNPAAVSWLGSYDTAGFARNVKVVAGKAYIADEANGLVVLDVTNPANPILVATYAAAAPVLDLDVVVNLVAVARGSNGVEVLDVANPAAIFSLGTNAIVPANSLRIEGNMLYVAAGNNGVHVLELLGLSPTFPAVTAAPIEVIALPGDQVSFQATATGVAPLSYQWYQGDTPLFDTPYIQGSRTPVLTRSNLVLADSSEYRIVVRNGWNLLGSAAATLKVVPVGTPVLRSGYFNDQDALNLQVVGNVAFIASRLGGLQAVDCRNPLAPVLVGQHATLGLAQDVFVRGRYAYVAAWDAGLEVFDILNPTNLVRVGSCDTPGLAHAVKVTGHYAHIADRTGGYSVIDVRDPTQPRLVGRGVAAGLVEGLDVAGARTFVAAAQAGLEVFDTSDLLAPQSIARLDTPGNAEGITLAGNQAYISDYHRGVCIATVANPAAPALLSQFQTAGDAFQVQVVSNRAYISEGIGTIEVADINDPGNPIRITGSLAGKSVRGLKVVGQHAFIADREEGLVVAELLGLPPSPPRIVDLVSNLPAIAGNDLVLSVAAEGTPPLGYQWFRNGVFITNAPSVDGSTTRHLHFPNLTSGSDGNYTVLISNAWGSVTSAVVNLAVTPRGLQVLRGSLDTPGSATAVAVYGNVAYVADGSGGLRLADLTDPDHPVALGAYTASGSVYGVCLQTNRLYLALGTNGVAILDVSMPSQPALVGSFDTPGTAVNLMVTNGYAYIADSQAGLRIYSVTNASNPLALGFLATTGSTRDVRSDGNFLWLAEGAAGVRVVTVANPASPVAIGSYSGATSANAIRLAGTRAYVADGPDGLLILDAQDPAFPVLLGNYPSPDAVGLDLAGPFVVLADNSVGALVLDVTNPANPLLIGASSAATPSQSILVLGNLVFVAAGNTGLQLAELSGVAAGPVVYLTQPVNAAAMTAGTAQFQATVMGPPPLTYRWYHDGLPVFDNARIQGAATTHLSVTNISFADAGSYELRVLGPAGVTNSNPAQLIFIGPLQAQLNSTTNGAVVQLAPGTHTETLVLDHDLTLTGPWWNKPVLSAGNAGTPVHVLAGAKVTLRGLTIQQASTGGVRNDGTLTLDHCLITDNTGDSGAGIANYQTLYLLQSVVSNNFATASGGGLYNAPTATAFITNSTFVQNLGGPGAAIFNAGTNFVVGSLLANNFAQGNVPFGGGLAQSAGLVRLVNATVSGNAASGGQPTPLGLGGGAYAAGGRLEFFSSTVANNFASVEGGGVSVVGTADVHARNTIFANNDAPIAPDFSGTLNSEGNNLVQITTAELTVAGTTTGNQLDSDAKLGLLADNGGPTLTHAPASDSPVIDAGVSPGPSTDARGIRRPFDIPWIPNQQLGADIGAVEFVDQSIYLIQSNRTATGFTLAWGTNSVLQKAAAPTGGWLDQASPSPLAVSFLAAPQEYFRLRATFVPKLLQSFNAAPAGFDLAWPDFGILEHAPTPLGPWEPIMQAAPHHVTIVPSQNEFFRLRVIEH